MIRSVFLKVIFVVCVVVQFGCSGDSDPDTSGALDYTARGWSLYASGEYAQALLSFERAINFDENVADAHNGVGWSHLSLSLQGDLAQEAFQDAVRLDSSNADAWVGLANVLFLRQRDAGDYRSALRALDNAVAGDATYLFRHDYGSMGELYALRAACYYYLGEDVSAQQEVERSLGIEARNSTALVLQGLISERTE